MPSGCFDEHRLSFQDEGLVLKESSVFALKVVQVRILQFQVEGVIHRITPRRNDEVNDSWMSDSGRELYKKSPPRIDSLKAKVDKEECTLSHAIETVRYCGWKKAWYRRIVSFFFGRTILLNKLAKITKKPKIPPWALWGR